MALKLDALAKIYAKAIADGERTLEDTPVILKDKVIAILDNDADVDKKE